MSDIREYVMGHDLFCHHDHQQGYLHIEQNREGFDYGSLLGYAGADLVTASGRDMESEGLKHADIAALWPKTRLTGYGRAVELCCQGHFGLSYTEENWPAISEALQGLIAEKSGEQIYAEMLAKAQIRWTINDIYWAPPAEWEAASLPTPDSFRQTWRMDSLFAMGDATPIKELERASGRAIYDLAGLVDAMNAVISMYWDTGRLAAIKLGIAYLRDLTITDPTSHQAELALSRILNSAASHGGMQQGAGPVSVAEARPLNDYLLQRLFQRAADDDLPVQIHTGYLAGNWGALQATPAMQLIPVLAKYRGVRFDLFHASWPWCAEMGVIAKEFPNVWPDMCWMWAMNPFEAEMALEGWLDGVPHTKIFGFGADTGLPWNDLGYALQAKQGIANVLERRVTRGYYTDADAREVADCILLENGVDFYRLG